VTSPQEPPVDEEAIQARTLDALELAGFTRESSEAALRSGDITLLERSRWADSRDQVRLRPPKLSSGEDPSFTEAWFDPRLLSETRRERRHRLGLRWWQRLWRWR
jgi:hypothetical protein